MISTERAHQLQQSDGQPQGSLTAELTSFHGGEIIFSADYQPENLQNGVVSGEIAPRTFDGIVDEDLRRSVIAFEPVLAAMKRRNKRSINVNALRGREMITALGLAAPQMSRATEKLGSLGIMPFFDGEFNDIKDKIIEDDTIRAVYAFLYIRNRDFPSYIYTRIPYMNVAKVVCTAVGTDPMRDQFDLPLEEQERQETVESSEVTVVVSERDTPLNGAVIVNASELEEIEMIEGEYSPSIDVSDTGLPKVVPLGTMPLSDYSPPAKSDFEIFLDNWAANFDPDAEDEKNDETEE